MSFQLYVVPAICQESFVPCREPCLSQSLSWSNEDLVARIRIYKSTQYHLFKNEHLVASTLPSSPPHHHPSSLPPTPVDPTPHDAPPPTQPSQLGPLLHRNTYSNLFPPARLPPLAPLSLPSPARSQSPQRWLNRQHQPPSQPRTQGHSQRVHSASTPSGRTRPASQPRQVLLYGRGEIEFPSPRCA